MHNRPKFTLDRIITNLYGIYAPRRRWESNNSCGYKKPVGGSCLLTALLYFIADRGTPKPFVDYALA